MGALFTPVHLIILMIVAGVFLLPVIFYLITLQKTLQQCAPQSRTLEPALVWLYLIPLVNLVFGFFIVINISKSLRNEFNRRGIPSPEYEPGQSIGLAMCICACANLIPFVGILAFPAHIVLWIMYWVKIAGYSRDLAMQPGWVQPPATY